MTKRVQRPVEEVVQDFDPPIDAEAEQILGCRNHPDDGTYVLWDAGRHALRVICSGCDRTLVYLVAHPERVH